MSIVYSFFIQYRQRYDRVSGTSVDVRDIGFSSEPAPLSARFRPVREKWWLDVGLSSSFLSSTWLLSPKRANRPRFFCGCGLGSSFNPTSSNLSSGTRSVLSRCCCIDDRGVARERRTSRERLVSTDRRVSSDWRGYVSPPWSWMGDRAEMSCGVVSGMLNHIMALPAYKRPPVRGL
jgi:hypothetical protein